MNNQDIANALYSLNPNSQYVVRGDTLDGIEWLDTVNPRPTNEQILAAIAAYTPPQVQTPDQRIAALEAQVQSLLATQGK